MDISDEDLISARELLDNTLTRCYYAEQRTLSAQLSAGGYDLWEMDSTEAVPMFSEPEDPLLAASLLAYAAMVLECLIRDGKLHPMQRMTTTAEGLRHTRKFLREGVLAPPSYFALATTIVEQVMLLVEGEVDVPVFTSYLAQLLEKTQANAGYVDSVFGLPKDAPLLPRSRDG